MAIHRKTKKRVGLLVIIVVVLTAGVFGAYQLRQWQRDKQAQEFRQTGMAAFEAGKYREAIPKLRRYVRRFEDDAEALRTLIDASFKHRGLNGRNIALALQPMTRLLDLEPDDTETCQRLLKTYLRIGYSTEAIAMTDEMLAESPDDREILQFKAAALRQARRFKEALAVMERCVALDETDIVAQRLLFDLIRRVDRSSSQPIARSTALQDKYPDNPRFDLLRAYAHRLALDREETEKWLKFAFGRAPLEDALFVGMLVQMLDVQGMFNESLDLLTRAAEAGGDESIGMELARRCHETNKFQQAIDLIGDLDPASPETNTEMVAIKIMCLMKLGQREPAKAMLDALAERKGDNVAASWAGLLRHLADQQPMTPKQRTETTIELAEGGLLHDPYNTYFHAALGEAYIASNQPDKAIESLQRAISVRPIWSMPHAGLASVLLSQGDHTEAMRQAVLAVRMPPQNLDSFVTFVRARAANLKDNERDSPQLLLEDVRKIQDAVPGEPRTFGLFVALLIQLQQYEEASSAVRQVLEGEERLGEAGLIRVGELIRALDHELELACYDLAETRYGRTSNVALAKAARLMGLGQAEAGTQFMEQAIAEAEDPSRPSWQLAWARFLDLTDDSRAKEQWIKLVEAHVDNAIIQRMALKARCLQGDRDFLEKALERLREASGESSNAWRFERARWLVANPQAQQTDQQEAAELLERIVEESPQRHDVRRLLSQTQVKLGDYIAALETLEPVSEENPEDQLVAMQMATLLHARRDYDRAAEQLERVIANPSATDNQLLTAAAFLTEQGRSHRAIAVLEKLQAEASTPRTGVGLMLARLYEQTNQIDLAEALCEKVLEQPTPAGVQFVSSFYAHRGRIDEARQALALLDGVKMTPGVRESLLGDFAKQYEGSEQAIAYLRQAIEIAPDGWRFRKRLIEYYLVLGQPQAAIETAEEAREKFAEQEALQFLFEARDLVAAYGSNDLTLRLTLDLLGEEPNRSRARDILVAIQQADANSVATSDRAVASARISAVAPLANRQTNYLPVQILVIQLNINAGRNDDAVSLAQRTMTAFPNVPEATRLATAALVRAKRWNEAIVIARQWKERWPADALAADLIIAEGYIRLDQALEAIRIMKPYGEQALGNPDTNIRPLTQYVRALIGAGKVDEAANLLAPLLANSAAVRIAWQQLAIQAVEDAETSAQWFARVQDHIPDDAVTERFYLTQNWFALAQQYGDQGALDRARELADRLIAMPEPTAVIWFLHGMIYEFKKEYQAGAQSYRKALELRPDFAVASNNLAMMIIHTQGDLNEALQRARQAVAAAPEQPNFLDTLAQVLYAVGQVDEAIEHLQKAVELAPEHEEIRKNLANMLESAGRVSTEENSAVGAAP